MISIENLTKSFDGVKLFDKINLQIRDGEFAVLSGPSGCGKTTLMNIIGAIEPVDSGKVVVNGIDVTNQRNHLQYFRSVVGFLFQNFALADNKTVKENLELVNTKYRSEITIKEALERVGLLEKLNTKVYKLSGGEQQRVALARLMIKKCNLILADEPTGSLDSDNADKIISILKELNQEGKTIVMVTHNDDYKNIGRLINMNEL